MQGKLSFPEENQGNVRFPCGNEHFPEENLGGMAPNPSTNVRELVFSQEKSTPLPPACPLRPSKRATTKQTSQEKQKNPQIILHPNNKNNHNNHINLINHSKNQNNSNDTIKPSTPSLNLKRSLPSRLRFPRRTPQHYLKLFRESGCGPEPAVKLFAS